MQIHTLIVTLIVEHLFATLLFYVIWFGSCFVLVIFQAQNTSGRSFRRRQCGHLPRHNSRSAMVMRIWTDVGQRGGGAAAVLELRHRNRQKQNYELRISCLRNLVFIHCISVSMVLDLQVTASSNSMRIIIICLRRVQQPGCFGVCWSLTNRVWARRWRDTWLPVMACLGWISRALPSTVTAQTIWVSLASGSRSPTCDLLRFIDLFSFPFYL